MAKKQPLRLPTQIYYVVDDKVGAKLGPYPVLQQGGRRVVALNDRQAKYYLTTGSISEQRP